MQPGDLVRIKLRFTPKDWPIKKSMIGILIRKWSDKMIIPEFDFFGEIEEDVVIELEEPYWEVKLANGKKDYFKESELKKIV